MSGVDQELVCNGFYRTERSLMKQEMGGDPSELKTDGKNNKR